MSNNGFVFFTLNGGIDWEQVNPNIINSNQVFDVYARTDGQVWVPGKYASIQYTMDNGLTWSDQTPGTKSTLTDVAFDGNADFAVGSEGAILCTMNGGAIWENIAFDPLSSYTAVCMIEEAATRHVLLGHLQGQFFIR